MNTRFFEATMIEGFDGYTFDQLMEMPESRFRKVMSQFVESRWNQFSEWRFD